MALVEIDWNPDARRLRQFAGIGVAALLTLAVVSFARHGWSPVVAALGATAAGLALCGVAWPRGVRYPYLAMVVVTFPIGWLVGHALLGVVYFGLFSAVATAFRLTG